MKEKTITVYFCDHCNKLYQRKHAATEHEANCKRNPTNQRPCFNCQHLGEKMVDVYFEHGYGEHEEKRKVLFCSKFEHAIYPPDIERKKTWYELDPEENNPMPHQCESQKIFGDFRDEISNL